MLLAFESKGLLIGEAADPEMVAALREMAAGKKGVVGVGHVLTVHLAPDQITAMINVDFARSSLPAKSRKSSGPSRTKPMIAGRN